MFWSKKRRRARLLAKEFDPQWIEILKRNVRYYHILPNEMRKKLQGLIQIFLDEKIFEGCRGMNVTEEMKITIAAQACILLLGHESEVYAALRTILLYPHSYFAPVKQRLNDGSMIEGVQFRSGESWSRGQIVLAWDVIQRDMAGINESHNLIFHEFAHQIDYEFSGTANIPETGWGPGYVEWSRVLTKEYHKLINDIAAGQSPLINEYGATSPAEFFAVVTEYFFEKPEELKFHHPELYQQFVNFYNIDTAEIMHSYNNS